MSHQSDIKLCGALRRTRRNCELASLNVPASIWLATGPCDFTRVWEKRSLSMGSQSQRPRFQPGSLGSRWSRPQSRLGEIPKSTICLARRFNYVIETLHVRIENSPSQFCAVLLDLHLCRNLHLIRFQSVNMLRRRALEYSLDLDTSLGLPGGNQVIARHQPLIQWHGGGIATQ